MRARFPRPIIWCLLQMIVAIDVAFLQHRVASFASECDFFIHVSTFPRRQKACASFVTYINVLRSGMIGSEKGAN